MAAEMETAPSSWKNRGCRVKGAFWRVGQMIQPLFLIAKTLAWRSMVRGRRYEMELMGGVRVLIL